MMVWARRSSARRRKSPAGLGPAVNGSVAGSVCEVQKIGWMSAELRGSATKSQPPLFGELPSDVFGQSPDGHQFLI